MALSGCPQRASWRVLTRLALPTARPALMASLVCRVTIPLSSESHEDWSIRFSDRDKGRTKYGSPLVSYTVGRLEDSNVTTRFDSEPH